MITIAGTDNPQYESRKRPPATIGTTGTAIETAPPPMPKAAQHEPLLHGSEDLDTYGRWTTVPDYGRVWVPNVAPGWAPYRAGRWVWQPYFGWTWVSYESWGWAPYHYGRWLPYGAGWAWWPGPVATYPAYYPVWAPAYVSFFGLVAAWVRRRIRIWIWVRPRGLAAMRSGRLVSPVVRPLRRQLPRGGLRVRAIFTTDGRRCTAARTDSRT